MVAKQKCREAARAIESSSQRLVHFVFNPKQKVKETAFVRKFTKLLDGTLAEFEREEHERFETYIDKLRDETLEDGESCPVTYQDSPFYDVELGNLGNLSFAVADNPFFKLEVAKYYPEVHVISENGEILETFNPSSRARKGEE